MESSTKNVSCRVNYHSECEAGLNKQIHLQLCVSYAYQAMAFYFDRDDVALPNFKKYFLELSGAKREDAEQLMHYQNKRGGRLVHNSIEKPANDEWGSCLQSMQTALSLEKQITQSFLDLHRLAKLHKDPEMRHYLAGTFLSKQQDIIKELSDFANNIKNVDVGLGEFMFDKQGLSNA